MEIDIHKIIPRIRLKRIEVPVRLRPTEEEMKEEIERLLKKKNILDAFAVDTQEAEKANEILKRNQ